MILRPEPMHKVFAAKLSALLASQKIAVKSLSVLPGGYVIVTLYGQAAAERVAELLAPLIPAPSVHSGYDRGVATEVRQSRRADVKVWRVQGVVNPA